MNILDKKAPVAITIAGSDSGGGAGIQADLKTFAALGVHGATAITSVTVQNTLLVEAVQPVDVEIVRGQIRVVAEDLGIDAGKTGMLYSKEIIEAVSSEVSKYGFSLVVDPVMVAKSGGLLLKPDALESLRKHLIPLATVVTPNIPEAERLAGMSIRSLDDVKEAAVRISRIGAKAVVVKGGHLEAANAVDVLYLNESFKALESPWIESRATHGTGCSFSAAIAAGLAKGASILESVKKAKELVTLGIRFGLNIGRGNGPVNPMAHLYLESSRFMILKSLEKARVLIESSPEVSELIPEVGLNIAMAIPYAETLEDVAAFPGRIVKCFKQARAVGCARFGASSHLAKYLINIMKHDARKRAAINVKYSEEVLRILEKRGLKASFYDRSQEPEEIKSKEGMTIPWGVEQAVKKIGFAPDVIYHMGDIGKEPMIVVFGEDAEKLADLAVDVSKELLKGKSD